MLNPSFPYNKTKVFFWFYKKQDASFQLQTHDYPFPHCEFYHTAVLTGFSGGSVIKNLPVNAGDSGLIPGLGKTPGEGNGNTLQYSCPENPMERGTWWATVHEVPTSWTRLKDK